MTIQEPITVLTCLPVFLFSIFAFVSLIHKQSRFSLAFLFLTLMSLCGILYHIDNHSFFSLQKYGTMTFGGLLSTSFTMAALFDSFNPKISLILSSLPIASLIIYFANSNINSFTPFIMLQLFNFTLILFSYSRKLPSTKSILIYLACLIFLFAGFVQTQNVKFFILNHNDLFHLISLISIFLLYRAININSH